ncbi:MAG: diheme cytochrome c-553 [Acidobacteriota bacterium]
MFRARTLTAGCSFVFVLAVATACGPSPDRAREGDRAAEPAHEELVRRGEYLVTVGGCNDCHTPWVMGEDGPAPDTDRRLSGHPEDLEMPPPPELPEGPWAWLGAGTNTAFAGPWGVTYATNLTPDENTGLGIWSEDMFLAAMQEGRHMGRGRPIMPPMPWQNLGEMEEEDLRAIFAYLQSLPAIENHVPEYRPPEEGSP